MRKFVVIISFLFLSGTAFAQPVADGLTLKECYALALQRSESIAIQKEYIKETEGQMLQSLSTALPKAAFSYSEKWQDVDGSRSMGGAAPEGKFTLSQPLFTGFKEFAAIGASKHVGRQRQQELKRAEELLFTDVADAFYLYLNYQQDLQVLENTQNVLFERVGELKKRQMIGKSRPGEVASAEAKLRRNEALLEVVRAQKEVAGQLMEFLIGRTFDRLVDEAIAFEDIQLPALYLKADERADVVAARESFAAYKNNMTAARSSFFPTVTLAGNVYTKRVDLYEDNDWDATLTVNVPLFNGLSDVGQVAQARAQMNTAELKVSQVKRRVLLEVRNVYTKWVSADRKLKAFDRAAEASEKNYKLQAEDFQKSLVSNLDVLQALEDLQGARRDLVAAQTDAARSYWALKVATGDIK
jgi:outer membrane protein